MKDKPEVSISQYWDFNFQEESRGKNEADYVAECDRLFKQAVRRQLVSDVEVGSYLSGGTDSGSITALAAQHFKDLKSFCIGFDLSSASGLELGFDERQKAEYISYLYQTEHYEMVLKSGDMQRCLPDLVWSLEDLRLGQSYPNYYAAKLASRFYQGFACRGAGGMSFLPGTRGRYFRVLNQRNFDEYSSAYYKYWQRLVPNMTLRKLFAPIAKNVENVWTEDIFKNVFTHHKHVYTKPEEYINHSLYFEAKTFLHGLLVLEDKLSMAHSLEVRVPFLDNDLVDFAMRLPVKYKLKNVSFNRRIDEDSLKQRTRYSRSTNEGKKILRKVLSAYVGKKFANLQKQGFSGPDASWFKGDSINYVTDLLLDKKALIYNYFDYAVVHKVINEHRRGKHNWRLFIWSLLSFEWWLRIFLTNDYFFYRGKHFDPF